MAPSIDPSQWTYTDYVCFLRSHGFPNLGILDEYLEWGRNAKGSSQVRQPQTSRTMLLEFNKSQTRVSDLSDIKKLRLLLNEWSRPKSANSTSSTSGSGRIILVEDITPAAVDTLGGLLNIDPSFFATHLEDASMGHSIDASSAPALASKTMRDQGEFFTSEYISAFVPIGCPKEVEGLSLQCMGNYPRRIELVQKQGRQKVALARRKISFFMKKASDSWICVVLVDAPLGSFSTAFTNFNNIVPTQSFAVMPYDGGYLDFISIRKPLDRNHHDFRDCRHRHTSPSAFDELIRHFQIQARDGLFQASQTSLPLFMRPCFQIAASETASFLSYITTTLDSQSPHLTSTNDQSKLRRNLDRISFIDAYLSRFEPILNRTKVFLSPISDLKEDYRSLISTIHQHRSTCESQLQHTTSLLSSHDTVYLSSMSSEAMRRADYLRYLTIIALIYAPFAIACAIFTMPREFAPAAHYLYGFIPVTAGVTILFLLLVLPESRDSWPSWKDRMCGGLGRKKLLRDDRRRPGSRGTSGGSSSREREKWGMEDV